jgi:hypothetical protein
MQRDVLAAIRYQPNRAVLHTDAALLPRDRALWSAWNYFAGAVPGEQPVGVSYLINKLQPLPFETPVIVTLNPAREPDPAKVIAEFDYAHPIFDGPAIAAQQRLADVQGEGGIWLAGAWGSYGFHEDGLKSALRVANGWACRPPGRDRAGHPPPQRPETDHESRPHLFLGHVMHRRLRPAQCLRLSGVLRAAAAARSGGGELRHFLASTVATCSVPA